MTASSTPSLTLHPLHRANGSAQYTCPTTGAVLLAAVNSPLESSRRDKELPESAALDIHVRPSSNGSGGPRERWLESILAPMLRQVVLVQMFPRLVVQISVQVLTAPAEKAAGAVFHQRGGGGGGFTARFADVVLLPSLVNAIFAALVDAAVPMSTSVVAGLGICRSDGSVATVPGESAGLVKENESTTTTSLHAMVFTAQGGLIMEESVGAFGIEEWGKVVEALREVCLSALGKNATSLPDGGKEKMRDDDDDEGSESVAWLRDAVEREVEVAGKWRESG